MYSYCWNSLFFCGMVSTESFVYNWKDYYEKYRKGSICISKCENFDPFFSMEYDSMILKTHLISL